jgi:hypothetical protein
MEESGTSGTRVDNVGRRFKTAARRRRKEGKAPNERQNKANWTKLRWRERRSYQRAIRREKAETKQNRKTVYAGARGG